MERIEYSNIIDKSRWPRGVWDTEPDKVQWQDHDTKLLCLALRGPAGALCGYVGVALGHPFWGVPYSECYKHCGGEWCEHRPDHLLNVHWGLTFSGRGSVATQEAFKKFYSKVEQHGQTALQYPESDSARWLEEWVPLSENYEFWAARFNARNICHVPSPGDPVDVWWFGFDCAHSDDYCPTLQDSFRIRNPDNYLTYRDLAYVTRECTRLAKQLAIKQHINLPPMWEFVFES